MNELIKVAYDMMGNLTPLLFDCGEDCDRACCDGAKGYMILFPNEIDHYKADEYNFSNTFLDGYGQVDTLECEGRCDRDRRPLACRIFPLAPKIVNDEIFVRMDARGRPTCHLTHNSMSILDKEFIIAVKNTLIYLAQDKHQKEFIHALAKRVDKFANFKI